MKYKIKDLFFVSTGKRITEKEVYSNKGDIPCVTSQTTNNGVAWFASESWIKELTKNSECSIIDKECITWAKDGQAGKLFFRNTKFYPNDHCGVLIPKKSNINLKWFLFTQENHIKSFVINKSGQGMLYNEQMENIEIDLPSINEQNEFVKKYEHNLKIKEKIQAIINKIENLNKYLLVVDGSEWKIKDLCYVSRGTVISDFQLYKNKGKIPVYTSQTSKDGQFGTVSLDYFNSLTIGIGKPDTLTWTTDGSYAGTIFKRNTTYVYSNVCGMLEIKNKSLINIDYLKIILTNVAKNHVGSNGNNQKLMKTTMENIKIKVPSFTMQIKIIQEYERLNKYKHTLNGMLTT